MIDRITAALSRRNMLMGLALSATAVTMADASTSPQENPELVAMADDLPAVLAEYVAARDNVKAIAAEWSPQWPVPSEDIYRYSANSKQYRDILGRGVEMPWGKGGLKNVPQLGAPEAFEAEAIRHEAEAIRRAATKSQRGMKYNAAWAAKCRAAIEPARAYWSEVDRITALSGIESAQARKEAAGSALKAAVDQIMMADDWTIAGAVIKAQALSAWAEVEHIHRTLNDRGAHWADALAASIVKHASATA